MDGECDGYAMARSVSTCQEVTETRGFLRPRGRDGRIRTGDPRVKRPGQETSAPSLDRLGCLWLSRLSGRQPSKGV